VSRIVLDSSALLAILQQEAGAELFLHQSNLLNNFTMSAVNVAEAYGKLLGCGMGHHDAWESVTAPVPQIVEFDTEQARIAGGLLPQTRSIGLSLGDRACLALGIALQSPVYTADRAWKRMKIAIPVHVIR
jgi:ribonuclease VapC